MSHFFCIFKNCSDFSLKDGDSGSRGGDQLQVHCCDPGQEVSVTLTSVLVMKMSSLGQEMKYVGYSKLKTRHFYTTHSHINGYNLSRTQLDNILKALRY